MKNNLKGIVTYNETSLKLYKNLVEYISSFLVKKTYDIKNLTHTAVKY